MKIIKRAKVCLSRREAKTWTDFNELLNEMHRDCGDAYMKYLINLIQSYMDMLQKEMGGIE